MYITATGKDSSVTVIDDNEHILPFWNDFIRYLVVDRQLIVKLGHFWLQKLSPFFESTKYTSLPISKYHLGLTRHSDFSNLITTLSHLIQASESSHIKSHKIALGNDSLEWVLCRHTNFYWQLLTAAEKNTRNKIDASGIICYWSKYSKYFSQEMCKVFIWNIKSNRDITGTRYVLKQYLAIEDKYQMDRFEFLFNCNPMNVHGQPDFSDYDGAGLWRQLSKKIDIFKLINHAPNCRTWLSFILFIVRVMKENKRFREYMNNFRYKNGSPWGGNLDLMVKHVENEFYLEMQLENPPIIRWKV